jgi:type IX secretion system PorP/SprF family membrane protein
MRVFVIVIALFITAVGNAQHFPVYSQYLMNGLAINPAYAGSRDVLCLSAMYRNQWVGFPGAPVLGTLSAHMPLRNKSINVGLQLINETVGAENNYSLYGNYAYRFQVANGHLSFGLNVGFDYLNEDPSKLTAIDEDDLLAINTTQKHLMPNAGFGAFFYNTAFSLGLAIPRMLSYKSKTDGKMSAYNSSAHYNYLLSGAYLIKMTDVFKLKPSTLIRYTANTPAEFDLNLNAILLKDNALWIGGAYRSTGAIVGSFEYQINTQIRMGYSYDYTMGKLSNNTGGSHEILLRYEFRYKVDAINPKYF